MATKSKTQSALDYLAKNPKATPYQAAKIIGVATSVIYRAIKARSRKRCPECGHFLLKRETTTG